MRFSSWVSRSVSNQCRVDVSAAPRSQSFGDPHQTLDALTIDRMPPSLQLISDPAAAVERKLEVDLVDQTHQDQVFVRHRTGAAVRRRAGHLKQLAASGDW